MKNKIYFIILFFIFAIIIGGGIYYGVKMFITFSIFDNNDSGLVDTANDTKRIEGDLRGMGNFFDDFGDGIKRARSRVARAAEATERAESRVENIERNLAGIEQGAETVRAGIKIGEGAKERLGRLICRLESEDTEGSKEN